MSDLNVTGKIHRIYETETFNREGKDPFVKKTFVLHIEEASWSEYPAFELVQDRVDLIDQHKVGDEVTVSFNLCGRGWTNKLNEEKFFTSAKAWRIQNATENTNTETTTEENTATTVTDTVGDLPF